MRDRFPHDLSRLRISSAMRSVMLNGRRVPRDDPLSRIIRPCGMKDPIPTARRPWSQIRRWTVAAVGLTGLFVLIGIGLAFRRPAARSADNPSPTTPEGVYAPRQKLDPAGFATVGQLMPAWPRNATLEQIRAVWSGAGARILQQADRELLERQDVSVSERLLLLNVKAAMLNYDGQPQKAYQVLEHTRQEVEAGPLRDQALYSIIYLQGVTALRRGENENCILCRGESSCIIPISSAARHINPEGSRLAIRHFTEYLRQFPDDLEVRWLLNIAHMTLGEHPGKVDPRFLISLDRFQQSEFDIGRFRDIGHVVGLDHLSQGGGGIMEDFDNDGLLDIVVSAFDPSEPMKLFRNTGQGTFEDRSTAAGLDNQLGGINCMQTDYNNDGRIDVFVVRGAWCRQPMPPSLLRNEPDGRFTDVTAEAGLLHPSNSIAAAWSDYDNDGWLDLFVCCENETSRLYRNLGNGAFQDATLSAGLTPRASHCKGVTWFDYDNDDYPDLFVDYLTETDIPQVFHNDRDGAFHEVTSSLGIDGPVAAFTCWSWDFDNDGWLDIFATCYERDVGAVVNGLLGKPHGRNSNRLYRNLAGKRFRDVTREAGLDLILETMGANFGDFDGDGFLDMYLGTGEPDIAALVPNRMFKNVDGKRFADVTASTGTGNLQKGHGTACGDWDRDGDIDIFMEMGGAINGDKYHNILFQNPGPALGHNWLTVKLQGDKTNRPAIGARIMLVTTEVPPRQIHRTVTSGSSFGANPLGQTIGLGQATGIDRLEIRWPASGTTQVFRDVAVNQAISIPEFADQFQVLEWKPISVPELSPETAQHVRSPF